MTERYHANPERYQAMSYRRCGKSGIRLPAVSLGFWHNFGDTDKAENARDMTLRAFDLGIVHFDLANNYGPPPGAAEENFGRILRRDLASHRDELVISSKAGYTMWPGPYGDFGSRKHLVASLDQSLKRMGLDYVDIFYSHRPDPETPMEETMGALDFIVRSGRALYAGISSYNPDQTRQAARLLRELGTPCLIHQPSYSLLNRRVEEGLLDTLDELGIGCIAYCPLAQGILTDKYLAGIPDRSRAANPHGFLKPEHVTAEKLAKVQALKTIAERRGQSIAQLAIAWVLRRNTVTSALFGASRKEQVEEIAAVSSQLQWTEEELAEVDAAMAHKLVE